MAKCPKCDKLLASLSGQPMDANVVGGLPRKAVAYCCPFCNAVLGAEIDPIALRTEIVARVEEVLTKALRSNR